MLGMDFKAQILVLSVNRWNIEKENKSGFTLWLCMNESDNANKKGYEPVKQSLDISSSAIIAPLLSPDVKFPCVCDCIFGLATGGQSAKPVLRNIDKVVKSIVL